MQNPIQSTPDDTWLEKQILWFTHDRAPEDSLTEFDRYGHYVHALTHILGAIRDECSPLGLVSVRRKDPASFADKCIRKFASFERDPAYRFSDLCGGRIVVTTLAEMEKVRIAVRDRFHIVQDDDTRFRLSTAEFGYLSIHFDVEIDPDRLPMNIRSECAADIAAINGPGPAGMPTRRRAEVQVRTLLQHAWSDTLHDRLYKTKLTLPPVYKRQAAILAASLEELDNDFNLLLEKIDAYQIDYGAYLSSEARKQRVEALSLLLRMDTIDRKRRDAFTLETMRLLRADGNWEEIGKVEEKHVEENSSEEIRLLGAYASCRRSLAEDGSIRDPALFAAGESALHAFTSCPGDFGCSVDGQPDPCMNCGHRSGFRASALALAGWCVWRRRKGDFHRDALHYLRRASNCAPDNPYILRELLVCEAIERRSTDFVRMMLSQLESAIRLCEEHIAVRTEIPHAYFTAGMLLVFLGRESEGMVRYCQGAMSGDDGGSLRQEMEKADELATSLSNSSSAQRTFRTLHLLLAAILVNRASDPSDPSESSGREALWQIIQENVPGPLNRIEPEPGSSPVLILAGGAASLAPETCARFRSHLASALSGWRGILVSGGTRCGVPGIAGDLLEASGCAGIRAVGIHPGLLPSDAPLDSRYHQTILTHREYRFSAYDIVCTWLCLLDSGVEPEKVKLLGIGGGPIAALEYAMALAMGGIVGLVEDIGGSTVSFLNDRAAWSRTRLIGLPEDPATFRAFIFAEHEPQENRELEAAARAAHEAYRAKNLQHPAAKNLQPWEELDRTFQISNYDQVTYARTILASEGLVLELRENPEPVDLPGMVGEEVVERMAVAEHGRWNIERLRQGWAFGERDNERMLHPNIVPWSELDDKTREYDVNAVKVFPVILAKAGFQIVLASSSFDT